MIVGETPNVYECCVSMQDTIDEVKTRINSFISKCSPEDVKIILTDIPGGSTTQAAFYFIDSSKNQHVVSGINLGLLLELILSPSEDIQSLLVSAVDNGKETMKYLNVSFSL
jgi:mannose/fructose-specific phosphotransferase system component IIA